MAAKQTSSRSGGRKYGDAASKSVESAMRRRNEGTLRSGKGGRGGRVKSREQAVAIGLSEARKKGAKVPPPPSEQHAATAGYLGHEEDAGEAMANEGTGRSARPRKRSTSRKGAARRKTASKSVHTSARRKTTSRRKTASRRATGTRASRKGRSRTSRSMS